MPCSPTAGLGTRRASWSASGTCRSEGGEDTGPLGVGHQVAAVVPPGQLGDLVAGRGPQARDDPVEVEAAQRGLEDHAGRVAGMSGGVQHGDEAAHRVPEHDRPPDVQRVAEGAQVVGAALEAPRRRVVPARPAVVPQVEVDDLGVDRGSRVKSWA